MKNISLEWKILNFTKERVCLHMIEGGDHMFSIKHDVIAMEKFRTFASL